ncbi:MAG: hypothetical protein ACXVX9_12005, partial [Mycobacteriaceae bacterium]
MIRLIPGGRAVLVLERCPVLALLGSRAVLVLLRGRHSLVLITSPHRRWFVEVRLAEIGLR